MGAFQQAAGSIGWSRVAIEKRITDISGDDTRRVNALRLYNILDTAVEKAFDDLTQLAAAICDVPISLVSFVDEHRQWFKSRTGLEISETPKEQAFCAHAILQSEIMVVPDATLDPRFAQNPLVTGAPEIRFYAGAPLKVTGDIQIGTLCVIDRKPRTLTDAQLRALGILRNAVVTQLELRRSAADLEAVESLIPMCAWCRSVRTEGTDGVSWQPLHEYVSELARVTHGICPTCNKEFLSSEE